MLAAIRQEEAGLMRKRLNLISLLFITIILALLAVLCIACAASATASRAVEKKGSTIFEKKRSIPVEEKDSELAEEKEGEAVADRDNKSAEEKGSTPTKEKGGKPAAEKDSSKTNGAEGELIQTPPRIEDLYEKAVLAGPPGKLKLELIAFAYGSLTNINNKNSPEHSIKVLGKFPYLVCAGPGKLSPEARAVAEAIKGQVKIFGYVNMGEKPLISLNQLKKEIEDIAGSGWYGVFIDQFGYDFGETRARQNAIVDFAHAKGLKCFVNAWFIDEALGNNVDPRANPRGEPSHLKEGDWYLLESFLMSNSGYRGNVDEMLEKYWKAQRYQESLGIKIACLSYKRDEAPWEKALADISLSYLMALSFGFNGWWFSDRLEDDAFLYGKLPDIDWGNELIRRLYPVTHREMMAETDKYIMQFNLSGYPPVRYTVFDKSKKKE